MIHESSTTCLVNQAATAMEAEDIDTDQLLLTRQMLVEKVETLKVLDGEMAELVPEEELEEEIQRADEYKERVYGVLAKLNKALGPITAPLPTVVARTEPSPTVRRLLPAAETSPPLPGWPRGWEERPELELQGPGTPSCDCACLAVLINSLDT